MELDDQLLLVHRCGVTSIVAGVLVIELKIFTVALLAGGLLEGELTLELVELVRELRGLLLVLAHLSFEDLVASLGLVELKVYIDELRTLCVQLLCLELVLLLVFIEVGRRLFLNLRRARQILNLAAVRIYWIHP